MITKLILKRDAAADWASNNPTLAQAEIGIETDTDKLKIGDGSSAWNTLGYSYYLASEVDTLLTTLSGNISSGWIDNTEMTTISGDIVAGYVAADVIVTSAFGSADTTLSGELYNGYVAADAVVTSAFGSADTTLSGELYNGYVAADVVVTSAFGSADTTLSGELYNGYVAADAVVTGAFEAADTTLSGILAGQLHTKSHAITSTADHTGGNWKVIYSDGSGEWQELEIGVSGTVLTSHGASVAPVWE